MSALAGKVALVTGGTSGIGHGVALALAAAGAAVVVSGRNAAEGAATVEAIAAAGGEARFIACDVSKEAAVEALVAGTVAAHGKLDVAFNGAGTAVLGPLAELTEEGFDRVFAVNVKGLWLCLKHEIRQMLAQGHGGSIINAGSVQSHIAFGGSAHYTASKHAVAAYTRSAAKEYARFGIRVNQIAPGLVITPMTAGLLANEPLRIERTKRYPIGRLAEVSDVVGAVLFLASDAAAYVNGISLPVDGGYLVD